MARWSLDHRRGLRPYDLSEPDLVAERAFRNLAGYGPLEPLLDDDDVWEIMVNAPDAIFVKRHRGRSGYHDEVFHDDEHVIRTLTKILDDATGSHRKLDPSEGLQDAQLDDGARLHIVHGDISRGGHVMVNIRKFTGVAFHHLDQLVERDMLSRRGRGFLAACVRARPDDRRRRCARIRQDDAALVLRGRARPRAAGRRGGGGVRGGRPAAERGEHADPRGAPGSAGRRPARLVAGFLRMAPDVAIVGEVRDREALPLLLTLSSGVKGFTTIHAGSARQALTRLRFICQLSDSSNELPLARAQHPREREHRRRRPLRPRAAGAAGHRDRRRRGPRRRARMRRSSPSRQCSHRPAPDDQLVWTGNVPVRLEQGAPGPRPSRCPSCSAGRSSTPPDAMDRGGDRAVLRPVRRRRCVPRCTPTLVLGWHGLRRARRRTSTAGAVAAA